MGGERIEGGLSLFGAQVTPVPTPVTAPGESSPQNNSPVIIAPNEPPPFDFSANLRRFALQQQFQPLSQQITPQPHPTPPALVVWSGAGAGSDVNGLRAGDAVAVRINPNDTQADVLRRAYTAYAERAGLSSSATSRFVEQMMRGGERIQHAGADRLFTDEEFAARREAGTINMIVSEGQVAELRRLKIEDLLSYGVFDWAVTESDEQQIVGLLRGDPNVSQTVRGLNGSNSLSALFERVDGVQNRRELIGLLGRGLDAETSQLVLPHIERLDYTEIPTGKPGEEGMYRLNENLWQVHFNLSRLGVVSSGQPFDRAAYRDLIGDDSSPFTGVGATGANPSRSDAPFLDELRLYLDKKGVLSYPELSARYSNPNPSLSLPASTEERRRQVELLVRQPISTTMPELYGGQLPSRADVMRAAARQYNLEPELIAAFILTEQRDQSRNEDAIEYSASVNPISQYNGSIGLGQVLPSTVRNHNLFADLLPESTRRNLSHNNTARLLASDEVNIFAMARYIRRLADMGASPELRRTESARRGVYQNPPVQDLTQTATQVPGINFEAYARNSSEWTEANVYVLGSEYTSDPWNNVLVPAWGRFVLESYRDVKASGEFNR